MDVQPTFAEMTALMQRAKQGDAAAFESVYSHLYVPVFRYIARRVHDSRDTEDLAQQVFLKLLASRTPFTETASGPLAYLFTIARTTVIDYWKQRGRAATSIEQEQLEQISDAPHDPHVTSDIAAALHILAADQRSVIELKFFHGFTTSEIAARLNKSEAAIRQIQCRALRMMREHISVHV